jgi:hypothetical protein
MFFAFDFTASKISPAFLRKYTQMNRCTDKSVVTLTLDTEIIKLDTPFFSHFTLQNVNQIFWITPPIFSVYLFP